MKISAKTISDDLIRIISLRDIASEVKHNLDKIVFDKRIESTHRQVAVIDFSDLYRYLHPFLDQTAYLDYPIFYLEQFSFEYVFNKLPFELYLAPEYRREYLLTLEGIRQGFTEFASGREESIKLRVLSWDKRTQRIFGKHTKKTEGKIDRGLIASLAKKDIVILDLLYNNVVRRILSQGYERYNEMLKKKTLYHNLSSIVEGHSYDDSEVVFSNKNPFLGRLNSIRPDRSKSNQIDAAAFLRVQSLNKQLFQHGFSFVYITSSFKVLKAFESEAARNSLLDRQLLEAMDNITTIREPQYFILRLLLESESDSTQPFSLSRFPHLINRYLHLSNRVQEQIASTYDRVSGNDEDQNSNWTEINELYNTLSPVLEKLMPSSDLLGRFHSNPETMNSLNELVSNRLSLKPLMEDFDLSENDMRSAMAKLVANPRKMVYECSKSAKSLNRAILDMELSVLPLYYKPEKSDFIYAMRKFSTDASDVKKKAQEIVLLLSMFEQRSFQKAFRLVGKLRDKHPLLLEVHVLTSKVFRSMSFYAEALDYAKRAHRIDQKNVEAVFELGICYRGLALKTKHFYLLNVAWQHVQVAHKLDEDDPRVIKEMCFLLWCGIRKKPLWRLPKRYEGNAISSILKAIEHAHELAISQYGKSDLLTAAIMNDFAYYLSLSGKREQIDRAIGLIDEVLEKIIPELDRSRIGKKDGAFYDTRGWAKLKKYQMVQDVSLLDDAQQDIYHGHMEEPENEERLNHLSYCTKLDLEQKGRILRNN